MHCVHTACTPCMYMQPSVGSTQQIIKLMHEMTPVGEWTTFSGQFPKKFVTTYHHLMIQANSMAFLEHSGLYSQCWVKSERPQFKNSVYGTTYLMSQENPIQCQFNATFDWLIHGLILWSSNSMDPLINGPTRWINGGMADWTCCWTVLGLTYAKNEG